MKKFNLKGVLPLTKAEMRNIGGGDAYCTWNGENVTQCPEGTYACCDDLGCGCFPDGSLAFCPAGGGPGFPSC